MHVPAADDVANVGHYLERSPRMPRVVHETATTSRGGDDVVTVARTNVPASGISHEIGLHVRLPGDLWELSYEGSNIFGTTRGSNVLRTLGLDGGNVGSGRPSRKAHNERARPK